MIVKGIMILILRAMGMAFFLGCLWLLREEDDE